MEKEFVPYEIALALKELGFDEPCFGWYASDKSLIKDYVIKMHLKAPIFSQAFRWFREKHDLHHLDLLSLLYLEQKMNYEEAELECLKKLIEITKTK